MESTVMSLNDAFRPLMAILISSIGALHSMITERIIRVSPRTTVWFRRTRTYSLSGELTASVSTNALRVQVKLCKVSNGSERTPRSQKSWEDFYMMLPDGRLNFKGPAQNKTSRCVRIGRMRRHHFRSIKVACGQFQILFGICAYYLICPS